MDCGSGVARKIEVNDIYKAMGFFYSHGFFCCAPGRAHLLGGASPLYTRQGEVLAGRQVSEDSEVTIVRC